MSPILGRREGALLGALVILFLGSSSPGQTCPVTEPLLVLSVGPSPLLSPGEVITKGAALGCTIQDPLALKGLLGESFSPPDGMMKVARGREILEQARDRALKLDRRGALKLLEAQGGLLPVLDPTEEGQGEVLWEWAMLRTTLLHLEADPLARAVMEAALGLQPRRKADPTRDHPAGMQVFEEVRRELEGSPPGFIEVRTLPPGCVVALEGSRKGKAPLEIPLRGRRTIEAHCPGESPVARTVEAAPGEREILLLSPLLEKTFSLLPVPHLATGEEEARALATLVARTLGGTVALVTSKLALFSPEGPVQASPALELLASREEGSGGAWYRKWWFWSALAALAVGATVAALAVTEAQDPPAPRRREGEVMLEW